MKKAIIVSSFDTYMNRISLLKEYYEEIGYQVILILSNFRHIKKTYINVESNETVIYVPVKSYYKNLSYARLSSHYKYAKSAFKIVNDIKPDLLHVLIPANSLAKQAAIYKKNNPSVELNFDVIDLWPETIPLPCIKNIFPLTMWKKLREKNLEIAENIFCECELFYKKMKKKDISKYHVLVWTNGEEIIDSSPNISIDEVCLCYLGSMNNILDINLIAKLVHEIQRFKSCRIHIIGNGEKKQEFIDKIIKSGGQVEDHKAIYDKLEKQKIFDTCNFGLNIMKSSACVGLTMKSLDYFAGQLPIINSIPEDTKKMVDKYCIGINITENNISDVAKKICNISNEENIKLRDNTKKLYISFFSKKAFFDTISNEREYNK